MLMFNVTQIHPLVEHIKKEKKWTWKQFASSLEEAVLNTEGRKVSLTASNIRTFASGQSTASYFWGVIGRIAIELWEEEKSKASDQYEIKQIDLKYAYLFCEDLVPVYNFLYNLKNLQSNGINIEPAREMADILIKQNEEFFDVPLFKPIVLQGNSYFP